MTITWEGIAEFLKAVPGLLLFPISIYFAWKKIGYRVGCQVTISVNRTRGKHIGSIIFVNYKDRPIAITEIFAIQKAVKFQIEKPKSPILLKSLETIVVNPEGYSKYVCNGQRFEIDLSALDNLQVFVVTPEKTLECKPIFRPESELKTYSEGLDFANKIVNRFNDVVYGDDSRFAIVYSTKNVERTAIIDKHGIIDDSDHLGCNHIPNGSLTPDGIKVYLKSKTGLEVHAFELDHE